MKKYIWVIVYSITMNKTNSNPMDSNLTAEEIEKSPEMVHALIRFAEMRKKYGGNKN